MADLEQKSRAGADGVTAICDTLIESILSDSTFRVRLETRMRDELAAYGDLSAEEFARIPMLRWAEMNADRRSFVKAEDYDRFFSAGQIRAQQGVPAGEMLQAYRIAHQELRRRARELLQNDSDRETLLLELFERSIAYVDTAMVVTAEGHHAAELAIRWRDNHHHSTVVRKVLIDGDSSSSLRNDLESFGIDWSKPFYAVRARPDAGSNLDVLLRFLQQGGEGPNRNGLVALVDSDLCGFVADPPVAAPLMVIGVSPRVPFFDLPRAFELATRALQTAMAFGLPAGVYDIAGLGVRAAITADHDVSGQLYSRFIAPLEDQGESGTAIVDTVRRYLANSQRLDLTADELWVHVNTIRYRINRFERLTGCSLKKTDDLVAVWWALQYAQARSAAHLDHNT
ncbi:PucR family transcriptional regulator [Nocardia sp. NPDC059246]|uniref:PucR family transcriptional regulator n=1 Tax=unclassified Nocardia TaxID=2637762 RepID=UPI0036CD4C1F